MAATEPFPIDGPKCPCGGCGAEIVLIEQGKEHVRQMLESAPNKPPGVEVLDILMNDEQWGTIAHDNGVFVCPVCGQQNLYVPGSSNPSN